MNNTIYWTDLEGYFTEHDQQDYGYLVSLIPDNGLMAEVGSFRGKSICSIAEILKRKGIIVQSIDIFDRIELPEYIETDVISKRDGMLDDFRKNMLTFDLINNVNAFVYKSTDAAKLFPEKHFDLVFIDADHSYEAVKTDIEAWWPLIKDGGILCGHDYCHNAKSWPGVHKAIHEKFGQPYFGVYIWAIRKTQDGFNTNTF